MTLKSTLLLFGVAASMLAADGYHIVARYAIPGDGGWDYISLDSGARRLYVSHGDQVEVLNADTGEIIGKIPDTKGVHGIALATAERRGFTSNGKDNNVTVFELDSLKVLSHVKTGKKPDFILSEPATSRIFAFNGDSADATAIDAATSEVAGRVVLGGAPEAAASDEQTTVYVNLEDKNSVVAFDPQKLVVKNTWPLAPCEAPSSMAIDRKHSLLFIGCRNKILAVVNAKDGKVITTMPIGDHVDATAFDEQTGNIFSSNGDGTLNIFHQDTPDKYSVVQTVTTEPGAKTLAIDRTTHKIFLPVAKRDGAKIVPGSFQVLVVGN
jgi:DNA-binding beta-propeller fold protein YncE